MKEVIIDIRDYADEVDNDPVEMKIARTEGPWAPTADRVRVPRTGTVINDIIYKLVGFGKIDKAIKVEIVLPLEAKSWLQKWLGPAYNFQFDSTLRAGVVAKLKDTPLPDLKRQLIAEYTKNGGKILALQAVLWGKEVAPVEIKKEPGMSRRELYADEE